MAKNTQNFKEDFKKDFIAGSASGSAVALGTHGLDTFIVRSQTGTKSSKLKPVRLFDNTLRKLEPLKPYIRKAEQAIYKSKPAYKVFDAYRGFSPKLLKTTASGAIGYPVFMAVSNKLEKEASTNFAKRFLEGKKMQENARIMAKTKAIADEPT